MQEPLSGVSKCLISRSWECRISSSDPWKMPWIPPGSLHFSVVQTHAGPLSSNTSTMPACQRIVRPNYCQVNRLLSLRNQLFFQNPSRRYPHILPPLQFLRCPVHNITSSTFGLLANFQQMACSLSAAADNQYLHIFSSLLNRSAIGDPVYRLRQNEPTLPAPLHASAVPVGVSPGCTSTAFCKKDGTGIHALRLR